jgi:hypothetical protein
MDNNFINIDDLVKQRLSGEEEREPAGAWLRMRDLLEKEMPSGRPGGYYWRRSLSALSVVLLLSLLTAGGYEMNAYMRRGNSSDNNMIADASAVNAPAKTSANTSASNDAIPSAVINTNKGDKNNNKNGKNNENVTHSINNNQTANSQTATATVAKTHLKHSHDQIIDANKANQVAGTVTAIAKEDNAKTGTSVASADKVAATAAPHNDNKVITPGASISSSKEDVAAKNDAIKKVSSVVANDNGTGSATNGKKETANNNTEKNTGKSANTGGNENSAVLNNKRHKNTSSRATGAQAGAVASVKNDNDDIAIAANAGDEKQTTATNNGKSNAGTTVKAKDKKAPVVAKTSEKAVNAKTGKAASGMAATGSKKDHLLAMNTSAQHPLKAQPAQAGEPKEKSMDELSLNSHTSGSGNATGSNVNRLPVHAAQQATGKAKTTHATILASAATSAQSKKTKKGTSSLNTTGNAVASNATGAAEEKRMGERKIEKLVINQRYIKTSSFQGYYVPDTVSIQRFTEEYPLASNSSANRANMPNSAAKSGNAGAATGNAGAGNAAIVPGASTANKTTVGSLKETLSDKKSTGATAVESLSAAFNEIKRHVAGVQFAPGLTAGINGTFFGPTTFKGFQFGVTGNFIFSDNVSVMAELKYFNRLNNSYTYDDNFYTYTPAPGGYYRQMQTNEYTFPNLQSLELPISIRYNVGNFSFFAGGNLAYNFAVNTGGAPITPTTPATTVSTIGNDTATHIGANDFKSRFGLGYLFGASYQVSQNLTIDLRNVQTVWDNSSSSGSKIISGQLYKGPSMQMSIIYRLGNKKTN